MIVGIGIDVVEIRRMREILARQHDRFERRVYTDSEREYCRGHRDPAPSFAARFAAKEAVFKALGTGWGQGVGWQDVEVVRSAGQAPTVRLSGHALKHAERLGVGSIHLSLSHSEDTAVAMAMLEK
jgi:holo-[acyl-carrier protein] synthase